MYMYIGKRGRVRVCVCVCVCVCDGDYLGSDVVRGVCVCVMVPTSGAM